LFGEEARENKKLIAIPSANVARAAGAIMDRCTTAAADGGLWVKGANEAWGNGNLLVDIRNPNGS
jgi:hypothetical protein